MHTRGKSLRIFEHGVLERLSHVHPLTPLLLWMPLAAWLLWRSFAVHRLEGGVVAALALAGLVVWSFTEYAMHRFVFHVAPASPGRRRLQFIVHGVHHEDPDDPTRLVMPPAPAAVAVAILYTLFRVILGPLWVDPFFAWFLIGYLAYDYTHFAIHYWRPRTPLGRYLRRRHMLHHFVTPDARWGVTSPLWDWVFRTMGKRARVPRLDRPLMRGRFRWRMLAAAVLLISGVLVAADPARAAEWEWLSDKDGLLIERRPVNGSSFPEVRATAKSPLPPAAVFETLWKQREYPEFIPHLKRLDVLSDVGDDRVTYEQVAVPLGRDRDYTVRLRRRVDLWTQRYEILFASANEVGPPPDGRHERVRSIRGRWTVEPDPGGTGSVVRYEVQTDPGGVIPAWIVKRAQRGAVADLVRAVLTRAREMSGQK